MIKKISFFIFAWGLFISVHAVNADEINSFQTAITIQKQGTVQVVEQIQYHFSSDKHGIYRDIPFVKKNSDGKEFKLSYQFTGVTDEKGAPYPYSTSTVGDATRLKIGDADTLISGDHTYVITYTVSGALTYFSDHDELYWNVTGNGWEVPIQAASATVSYPTEIAPDAVKTLCYTGVIGSGKQNCTITNENNVLTVQTNEYLSGGEGLTLVVSVPKGVLAVLEPAVYTRFENTWQGKIIFGLIMLLFCLGLFVWYLGLPVYLIYRWIRSGRDPQVPSVRVWYDPPITETGRKLSSAETGALIDETVDARDIFSAIIQLAQNGYLTIEEQKKGSFVLHSAPKSKDNLLPFELRLLNTLFDGRENLTLKGADLGDGMAKVTDLLYKQIVADGYFTKSPQETRTKYTALAGLALSTGSIFLAIVAYLVGRVMPRKTQRGAEAASVARSLKTFLTSQDRQLAFQASNQLMFEKLLPYAIAFGVEKIWADRFKDIPLQSPSWYTGYDNGTFHAYLFANSLHSSMGTFGSAITPTRSSSGFSSGMGGGGGGSW